MKSLKKLSRKNIRKVEKKIQNLPATAHTFAYVQLYQSLQELYFRNEYELVCKICNALLNK